MATVWLRRARCLHLNRHQECTGTHLQTFPCRTTRPAAQLGATIPGTVRPGTSKLGIFRPRTIKSTPMEKNTCRPIYSSRKISLSVIWRPPWKQLGKTINLLVPNKSWISPYITLWICSLMMCDKCITQIQSEFSGACIPPFLLEFLFYRWVGDNWSLFHNLNLLPTGFWLLISKSNISLGIFFFFFCGTEVWPQGLTLARQALMLDIFETVSGTVFLGLAVNLNAPLCLLSSSYYWRMGGFIWALSFNTTITLFINIICRKMLYTRLYHDKSVISLAS
jgi:hypothetical protein